MKILLYGDYSSLHLNLCDGLRELGHECKVASDGNSWLKLEPDYLFNSNLPSIFGRLDAKIVQPLQFSRKEQAYDIVQFVNPLPISPRALPVIKYIFNKLFLISSRQYLLAAGDDYYYLNYGIKKMRYSPTEDAIKYDKGNPLIWLKNSISYWNKDLAVRVNGVIPVAYDYQCGYLHAGIENIRGVVPMPLNANKVFYKPNKIQGKIKIFHGLNRIGFKGTHYIREAFTIIDRKFGKFVECHIAGGMSLSKYLDYIRNFNINIDQTSSYSYGMNAIYAMASGQIVLSGAEPESLEALKFEATPIINITPNARSIVDAIEILLDHQKDFEQYGYQSRQFVEYAHSHTKVASRFLSEWEH